MIDSISCSSSPAEVFSLCVAVFFLGEVHRLLPWEILFLGEGERFLVWATFLVGEGLEGTRVGAGLEVLPTEGRGSASSILENDELVTQNEREKI